jgi:hypothetical protein
MGGHLSSIQRVISKSGLIEAALHHLRVVVLASIQQPSPVFDQPINQDADLAAACFGWKVWIANHP